MAGRWQPMAGRGGLRPRATADTEREVEQEEPKPRGDVDSSGPLTSWMCRLLLSVSSRVLGAVRRLGFGSEWPQMRRGLHGFTACGARKECAGNLFRVG
jgi:hypothetical protein